MKYLAILLAVTILLFLNACADKNKNASNKGPVSMIAADSICYSRHVVPILNSRCAPCHVGQTTAGVRLDSYDLAKKNIDPIIMETAAGTMPRGGPSLSTSQVDTLKAWRQNGEKACLL